jgi:hypothetical protein
MKRKTLALLACAVFAAFFGLSDQRGRHAPERARATLLSRLGISVCSLAGTKGDEHELRGYLVLLNVHGKKIGAQVEFSERAPIGLVAGANWAAGCR